MRLRRTTMVSVIIVTLTMGSTLSAHAATLASPTPHATTVALRKSRDDVRALCQMASRLDAARVVRGTPANPESFTFPATVQIGSTARARALARAVCALPLIPPPPDACPPDYGFVYTLVFFDITNGTVSNPVTIDPTGCQVLNGLGARRWAAPSPSFWTILGNAVGLTNATVHTFAGTLATS